MDSRPLLCAQTLQAFAKQQNYRSSEIGAKSEGAFTKTYSYSEIYKIKARDSAKSSELYCADPVLSKEYDRALEKNLYKLAALFAIDTDRLEDE